MSVARLHAVYGASGAGRGIMPLLRAQNGNAADIECLYVDDAADGTLVNSQRCLTLEQFLNEPVSERKIVLAVADGAIRRRLAERCHAERIGFLSVVAQQHVRMDASIIGEGAVFSPFTTVASNVQIGKHFHCNINSYVEHDCVIGDFVTFAPSVCCNGNIQIRDGAYIGTGAVIRQGRHGAPLTIGENAVVGMGAVVLGDVAPGEIVVGNPARVMRRV
ncbi:acetyltransferase [Altererythrobacter salegens]|uniref:Acetyltransferase n=1 Tax=Croceibacterium salegens TaxID=1737568 RepID=A0A6I4SWV2_9SPHN|nr:acetyltransferase [Croceibacterium salegens]MXO60564.1 acetyltransferase [Croceibacterium salegens]